MVLGPLLAAALAGCGAGDGTGAPSGSAGSAVAPVAPDAPVGTEVPPGDSMVEPRATRVPVVAGAVELRPRPFESAQPVGERQLAVRFWGGVAPCSVIARVDVTETPERVTVTLFGGRDPAPGRVACIDLAAFQEVVVDLAAPVGDRAIADGAR